MQPRGILYGGPVTCPLEVPADSCGSFLFLGVVLQGEIDGFLLPQQPLGCRVGTPPDGICTLRRELGGLLNASRGEVASKLWQWI